MAVKVAFKQACPSCEAEVPIKSSSLVGKKIDCPKCKYRFVVEEPGGSEADTPAEEDAPEMDEAEMAALTKKSKGASKNGKAAKGRDAEADADDEASDKPARKKDAAGSKKLILGLGLGAVGLAVLAVAGFLILGGKTDTKVAIKPGTNQGGTPLPVPGEKDKTEKDPNKEDPRPVDPAPENVTVAGPELTNLLPPNTEHVVHVFFKNIFGTANPIGKLAFAQGALVESDFNARLGLDVQSVDDVIRAERFTEPSWSFTVVHSRRPVNETALVKALGLSESPDPVKNQKYYRHSPRKNDAYLEQLGQFSFGAPHFLRNFRERARTQPFLVRVHDAHTVIFADQLPMMAYLEAEGKFKYQSETPSTPTTDPKSTPGTQPPTTPPGTFPPASPPGTTPPGTTPGKTPPGTPPAFPQGGFPPGTSKPPSTTPPGVVPPGVVPPGVVPPGAVPPGAAPPKAPPGAAPKTFNDQVPGGLQPPGGGAQAPGLPGGGQPPGAFPGGAQQPGGGFPGKGPGFPGKPGGNFPGKDFPGKGFPGTNPGTPGTPGTPRTPGGATTPPVAVPVNTYMTISPHLKAMLDRMELKPADSELIFSMATDMTAARLSVSDPEFANQTLWQYRQLWDVTNLLTKRGPQIRHLGASLYQRENSYRLMNQLKCASNSDAVAIQDDLYDHGAPALANFIGQLFAIKVELPVDQVPEQPKKGPAVGGQPGFPGQFPGQFPNQGGAPQQPQPSPQPKDDDIPKTSRIRVGRNAEQVRLTLDLIFDQARFTNLANAASLMLLGLRNELNLATGSTSRHALGKAAFLLPEQGLPDRGIPPGMYPPGAFKRQATSNRLAREPNQRVSWMAGLLPYLGQEQLYNRINFEMSWRDPANWLAAGTIVPEFIDPMFPSSSFRVRQAGLPVDAAATHFVGIAGIGLDAASYSPSDPSYDAKRGVFGYEGSRALREVKDNRGLANTILLIQAPHDSSIGVTPWIAGGGSTLRGVPETNSIAPFVLGKDRDGNDITHKGKRGTYAVMSDASVRFIDAKISDNVFKALCTVKGPAPAGIDDWAPLVPPAKAAEKDPKESTRDPASEEQKPEIPIKKESPPVTKEEPKVPVQNAVQKQLLINRLKQIGLAYHSCYDANKKPPSKVEELEPFYEKDAKITDAIRKGEIKIYWNVFFLKLPQGTSNTVLGHEKEVATRGGMVLMADGSVRSMTAAEFKKAPKPGKN